MLSDSCRQKASCHGQHADHGQEDKNSPQAVTVELTAEFLKLIARDRKDNRVRGIILFDRGVRPEAQARSARRGSAGDRRILTSSRAARTASASACAWAASWVASVAASSAWNAARASAAACAAAWAASGQSATAVASCRWGRRRRCASRRVLPAGLPCLLLFSW